MVNIVADLIRYTYFKKKPSINFSEKERELLKSIEEYNLIMH